MNMTKNMFSRVKTASGMTRVSFKDLKTKEATTMDGTDALVRKVKLAGSIHVRSGAFNK